jgi:hypothetical protein
LIERLEDLSSVWIRSRQRVEEPSRTLEVTSGESITFGDSDLLQISARAQMNNSEAKTLVW